MWVSRLWVWVLMGRGAMVGMMGLLLWRFDVVGLCVCVCVCVCFAHRRDGFASLSFFFLLSSHRSGFCDCDGG